MKPRFFYPLVILFVVVALSCWWGSAPLVAKGYDPAVLQVANCLLFVLSLLGIRNQIKAVASGNGQAMVRSVLGSVVLKLFVLGAVVFAYLYGAGPAKNEQSVLAAMFLYLCFTALETRMAMRIKPEAPHAQS